MTIFSRRLTCGRVERIQFTITRSGLERLLEAAGEIDKDFRVQECEFYEGSCDGIPSDDRIEVTLVRETPSAGSET